MSLAELSHFGAVEICAKALSSGQASQQIAGVKREFIG
jgi:hypothetical protein